MDLLRKLNLHSEMRILTLNMLSYVTEFGSDGEESACSVGDLDLILGLGRSPWRREWQTTPVFLPGESHEQRSRAGYSPRGRNVSNTTGRLTHIHSKGYFVFNISFIVDSAVCWPFSLRK